MTDIERIEEIRFFFKKNKTEFSKLLGYATPQSYTNFLNGGTNVSIKMLKALKQHNPNVSIDWIMYGQGNMILGEDAAANSPLPTDVKLLQQENKYLKEKLAEKELHIEAKDDLIELFRETLRMVGAKYEAEKKEAAEREAKNKKDS